MQMRAIKLISRIGCCGFSLFALWLQTPDLSCHWIPASLMQRWQSCHLSYQLVHSFSELKHIADLFLATQLVNLRNFAPLRIEIITIYYVYVFYYTL